MLKVTLQIDGKEWKVCSTGSDGDRNSFVVVVLVRSLIAGRTANDMFVKLLCLVGNWKS